MGRRVSPLMPKCPTCGSPRTEPAGRVVGFHCKACGAVWRPRRGSVEVRNVSKEPGGIPLATSAEELLRGTISAAPDVALDALRVLSLVKAIESRGEGHNLGQWCEMVMGWDACRAFDAIHHAVEKDWIAPNAGGRLLAAGEKGRAAR